MKRKRRVYLIIVMLLFFANCERKRVEDSSANSKATQNGQKNRNSHQQPPPHTGDAPTDDFEGTSGIVEKQYQVKSTAALTEIRTAAYPNYDRVVFEFQGGEMPGYHVEYIDKPVRQCGSGNAVPLQGDGWLSVRFYPAQAHNDAGQSTIGFREKNLAFPALKEIESTCDFEADLTWVLGVASPNRYRVIELHNPTRLVVDIKH